MALSLPLSARELQAQAALLADAAARLSSEQSTATAEAERMPLLGFTGDASDAAVRALSADADGWSPTIAGLSRAAGVLRTAALLQLDLDRLLALFTLVMAPRLSRSILAMTVLGWLQASGDLLDAMTAASLDSLLRGGDARVDPPAGWEDDPAGELQAGHDLLYSAAPPHLRELVDAHGLTLLELPEAGFVAAVADPPTVAAATHVVTHVPGVGSLDPASWAGHVTQARDMGAAVDTGDGVGVGVVWLGYPAPPTAVHGGDSFPARRAAVDLASFQHQLQQHFPDAARTVVGYSYGSVVVGHAAHPRNGGLAADDVVLVGSPGTGVRHASELLLLSEDPRVHAMTVPGDPILLATGPHAGVHGVDPASPGFGANVWRTDAVGDHGWYFRTGPDSSSEFLEAFGKEVGHRP